jgi:pimeloyl-[acyl-carrier protein] methyl ester esterase
MHFVLVHGWGFDPRLWEDVVPDLKGGMTLVDLGFLGGAPHAEDWPTDSVAVGHSLGLLWLLKEKPDRFGALVSVQGFDRFCPHIPLSRVETMRRGLARNAGATVQSFWRASGARGFASAERLDVARLDQGLDWLMHWDARDELGGLVCPVLALAARDDAIVPEAMTLVIWNGKNGAAVIWSEDGGHVLPLRRPEWCAQHILEFARAVRP